MEALDGRVAYPALWRVDDPLKGQVVVLRLDQPQVGDRVTNFCAFEEPRAADDYVGDLQQYEALFEGPHLERRADQDRHVAVAAGVLVRRALVRTFDLVGDQPALRLAVPDA